MDDPNFFRSVVLMVQHTDEHSIGLILNRPTDFSLEKVVSMVCEEKCVHDGKLYCGGPVEGPLIALHDNPNISGESCFDGVKICTRQEDLIMLFQSKTSKLKLFDGMAAWGPGQLEEELETGSWLVTDIDADVVLGNEPEIWDTLVRRIGQDVLLVDENITDTPTNPEWN
jgi:putative transcriptional regulator